MISKEAIKRGYNRGNYKVGEHTPPGWINKLSEIKEHSGMQIDPIILDNKTLDEIKLIADLVQTDIHSVVSATRDWWAGSMIMETQGTPATPKAVIVYVSTVEQIQKIMSIANKNSIPITVSAGRSNVLGAALPIRGGIVLDVCKLNKLINFDQESQIVEVEAGMFGDIFEKTIQENYNMTMGNWPSSFGISTVGGWIACRGAGQLSTRYGKIEDMVFGMDVVLADGSLITVGGYCRSATGPDLQQIFIGSEGTLGIIVRVRLKLHRLPEYAQSIAWGFQSFGQGLEACRQIMQRGATPAVMRLYDNLESKLQFGLDTNVLLIADEAEPEIVDTFLKIADEECQKEGHILDHNLIFERWLETRYLTGKSSEGFTKTSGFVADTLEMIGCWADLNNIYNEVVEAVKAVPGTLACSAHQSHAYINSACIYFSLRGDVDIADRQTWYRSVWDAANSVLIKYKASLSHHHGVGLVRAPYMAKSLGSAMNIMKSIKCNLDPKNILNPGKLGFDATLSSEI